jgi:uncharacterized protein YdbL (DUF1318 family)
MRYRTILQKAVSILVLAVLIAVPALALDLGEAKSSGLVGELNTGYLGAVKPAANVDKLVADINQQRKAQYQKIAKKNSTSLEAVESRAGQKAMEKTSAGAYINTGDGWRKK